MSKQGGKSRPQHSINPFLHLYDTVSNHWSQVAGTTGCLLLMWKENLGATDAIMAAKALRRVINPIGSLPRLLRLFEARRVEVLSGL